MKKYILKFSLILVPMLFLMLLVACNSEKEATVTEESTAGTVVTSTNAPLPTNSLLTVFFDKGNGESYDAVYVEKGCAVMKPFDPVKEGYTFVGWYYNDELYDFSKRVETQLVLFAKYEANN